MTLPFRAALFDMDGTLVDSRELVEEQWRRWSLHRGLDPGTVIPVVHGRRSVEIIQQFAPEANLQEEMDYYLAQARGMDQAAVTAVPGAREFVASLPEGSWAVVTSAMKDLALRRLAGAGFPEPKVIVGAAEVKEGKPDPEGFLLASRLLGVEPAECLIFEDAPVGVEAARRAGMRSVGLLTTHTALSSDLAIPDYLSLHVAHNGSRMLLQCSATPA